MNLLARWQIGDEQACVVLGGMDPSRWALWKAGRIGRIDRDLRARMAILMGIHAALRLLFADPARGYAWIKKPNAAFGGLSALDVMLRGEVANLLDLRGHLDAQI